MVRIFTRSISILIFVFAASVFARAQTEIPKEEVPQNIQESLAKQRIEREKKDFAEMLARGEEALKISEQLEKSFAANNQLSSDDQKKLDRLEKVFKKIRSELGGEGGDEKDALDDKPLSIVKALETLQSNTAKLVDELKKTTRYSVSVVAVESSNVLLKVVRFLRIRKN